MNTRSKSLADFRLAILAFFIFAILFIYSNLNLKNVDLGYQQHELLQQEKKLREEIDRLQARKAVLLNFERMEKIAIEELGLQYPEPDQIINVVENNNEN